MKERIRVVVFGSTLHMAGIAASLKVEASLEVVYVNPCSDAARQVLVDFAPVVVAFDLSDTAPGLVVSLLRDLPDLLLIGVDPSNDEMLVLSGRSQQALSVSDVVGVIHRRSSNAVPFTGIQFEKNYDSE
jgi:hypothetical protein